MTHGLVNQRYLEFSVEDFIADEDFQQWVKSPDPASDRSWHLWLAENTHMQPIIEQAAGFILNLKFDTSVPEPALIEASLQRSLGRIADIESSHRAQEARHKRRNILLMVSLVLFGLIFTHRFVGNNAPVLVEVVTGQGEQKTVTLPDSSQVTMNENSSVTYSSALPKATKREVWMKGEVFFNVKHFENATGMPQAFVVYSGDLKVEVLGTTFNIKSYRSLTNVSLNTGQIKIGVNDDPVSVTLQPGDFIQYSETEKKLVKRKVQAALYSTWKEKTVKLDKMPMKDIAQLIQDIYGYRIVFDEESLKESKISGTITVNDEKAFLDALAFVLDIDIQKKDSVLNFNSKPKLKKD